MHQLHARAVAWDVEVDYEEHAAARAGFIAEPGRNADLRGLCGVYGVM